MLQQQQAGLPVPAFEASLVSSDFILFDATTPITFGD